MEGPLSLLTEAERVLLVLMARGDRKLFGEVRRTSDGKRWRIDARPYGWIHGLAGVSFGDNREMAVAVLNVIRVKIAQGTPREDAVAEFLPVVADAHRIRRRYDDWLDHMDGLVEIGDRSPLTVREYRRYARKGGELDWWGPQGLTAVTEGALEAWSLWMAKERGLSPKTRQHVLGAFRAFLRWCKRKRLLHELPDFPRVAQLDHSPVILTPETQARILAAIPEADRGAHLAMALMGLRPGEARALTVGDYRPGDPPRLAITKAMQGPGPRARVGPTKTRRNRDVPAPEPVVEWIEAHWPASRRMAADPEAALFGNPRTGERWSHWQLRERWREACLAAGLPKAVKLYEGTKHTFATAAMERTKNERAVRDYLGHADARSTRRYASHLEQGLLEIAQRRRPE